MPTAPSNSPVATDVGRVPPLSQTLDGRSHRHLIMDFKSEGPMIYRPQLSCLAGLLVLATTTLASCITSRRNLHTPSILRHRLVLRVPSSSRCAQRRERRLCGVWVIFIRVRMTHTHRWTRRALHSRYGRVFSQEIYATFGYSNAGERIHDRHCSNRHRAGRFTHGNMRSKAAGGHAVSRRDYADVRARDASQHSGRLLCVESYGARIRGSWGKSSHVPKISCRRSGRGAWAREGLWP